MLVIDIRDILAVLIFVYQYIVSNLYTIDRHSHGLSLLLQDSQSCVCWFFMKLKCWSHYIRTNLVIKMNLYRVAVAEYNFLNHEGSEMKGE